jgi:hypothetical protein
MIDVQDIDQAAFVVDAVADPVLTTASIDRQVPTLTGLTVP